MTDIILKQGTGVPSDTDVEVAEVAIDTSSGAMYTKLADGSVKHLNPDSTDGGGSGGESLWKQSGDDIYYDDGNVGIGVTDPARPLHVRSNTGGSPQLAIDAGAADADGVLGFLLSGECVGSIVSNKPLTFHTNATDNTTRERMRIASNGNVGIGGAPDDGNLSDAGGAKLQVNGQAYITGNNLAQLKLSPFVDPNYSIKMRCVYGETAFELLGGRGAKLITADGYSNPNNLKFYANDTLRGTFNSMGLDVVGRVKSSSMVMSNNGRLYRFGDSGVGLYFEGASANVILPTDEKGDLKSDGPSFGNSTRTFNDAHFRGTVNAKEFVGDGSKLTNLPSGGGDSLWKQNGDDIYYNDGNVGIGGEPGTRTIDEAKALAKAKLTEWKAEVKKRTGEQPEASTQEITLEVTDGNFGVMPTEEALAEFLQGRAIGGGDAKLQVAGDGYFSGNTIVEGNLGVKDGYLNLSSYGAYQVLGDLRDNIRFGASNANFVSNGRAYGYEAYTTGEATYTNLRWCIGAKKREQNNPNVINDVEEVFNIDSDGNVNAKGDVVAYSSSVSDARLKDNVETINNALDKVCALRGVSYTWNQGSREGQQDIGVIAQEVETVFPEIVREHEMPLLDGETYKTVDYEKLCGVLIEAVKDLKAEVEALKRG